MRMKDISILKGVHPGIVLDQELKARKINKGPFALSLHEYPQNLGAITKGQRDMNTALALKVEHALDIEEGFFMILQVFYDIKIEKKKVAKEHQPDLSKFRNALFWDTDISKIDWQKNKKSVIKRVYERGNDKEKKEILHFYGEAAISQVLGAIK